MTLYYNDLPAHFKMSKDLAVDTETMGLKHTRDRLCLVQIADGHGKVAMVKFDSDYSAPNLKKLLTNPEQCVIFHYARFDVATLKYYLDIDIPNIFCTKIASKLVRTYTESHGLRELCRELLGITISKQQQSSDWGNKELSKEQIDYALRDVLHLHSLRDILTDMLKREGRYEIAQKLFKFIDTRAELDLMGWADIDIFAHA